MLSLNEEALWRLHLFSEFLGYQSDLSFQKRPELRPAMQ
jgi:hypothetical protein